jgi:hypothetical protein
MRRGPVWMSLKKGLNIEKKNWGSFFLDFEYFNIAKNYLFGFFVWLSQRSWDGELGRRPHSLTLACLGLRERCGPGPLTLEQTFEIASAPVRHMTYIWLGRRSVRNRMYQGDALRG